MKHNDPAIEFDFGWIVPISEVQYNPTIEWIQAVDCLHHATFDCKTYPTPHHNGVPIEAVIVEADFELARPDSKFCTIYNVIEWPDCDDDLTVLELEDNTLWEMIACVRPRSRVNDVTPIGGPAWSDHWSLRKKADECRNLIGPNAVKLYFVRPITLKVLCLHESRLPRGS